MPDLNTLALNALEKAVDLGLRHVLSLDGRVRGLQREADGDASGADGDAPWQRFLLACPDQEIDATNLGYCRTFGPAGRIFN